MDVESRRLHGWKEIAAHLNASERSVKRWERTRGLPVHRVRGQGRHAVFARTEELATWLANGEKSSTETGPALHLLRRAISGAVGLVRARATGGRRRRYWTLGAGGFLAIIAALVVWPSMKGGTSSKERPSYVLRLTVDQWSTTVGLREGECGRVELRPGMPLTLCPRADGADLLIVVSPAPAAVHQTQSKPLTIRLGRHSQVRVLKPAAFDVEWVEDRQSPRSDHRP